MPLFRTEKNTPAWVNWWFIKAKVIKYCKLIFFKDLKKKSFTLFLVFCMNDLYFRKIYLIYTNFIFELTLIFTCSISYWCVSFKMSSRSRICTYTITPWQFVLQISYFLHRHSINQNIWWRSTWNFWINTTQYMFKKNYFSVWISLH